MTKSAIGFLLALIAGLASSDKPTEVSPAAGPRSPVPAIPRLVEQADAIFKGEVRATRQVGTLEYTLQSGESATMKVMSAALHVDAVPKGAAPGEDEVSVIWYVRDVPDGFGFLRAGAYGLFFVSDSAAGYVVADPGEPYIPASRRPVPPDARRSTPLAAVEAELVNSLEDPEIGLACFAAMSLSVLPRAAATLDALRGVALNHPDPRCRGQAVATLLASADPSAMGLAVELLRGEFSLQNVETMASADQWDHLYYAIRHALHPPSTRWRLLGRLAAAIREQEHTSYARELLRLPDPAARDAGLQGPPRSRFSGHLDRIDGISISR